MLFGSSEQGELMLDFEEMFDADDDEEELLLLLLLSQLERPLFSLVGRLCRDSNPFPLDGKPGIS